MELLKKMRRKDQKEVVILNAPDSFRETLMEVCKILDVRAELGAASADFVLVFFYTSEDIAAKVPILLDSVSEDALLWAAYPKKASRNLKSDITRDSGWAPFGEYGYEPVGQISIDEDWSALRFRPVGKIKDFNRSEKMILSDEGKKRSKKKSET